MEIKENEVYSFKLTSGQEVVAKVVEIADDGYHVDAPLTIGQGQHGMEFIPTMFTAEFGEPAFMHTVGIALILPTREDVVEAYTASIDPSEIIKPGPKQIITG